MDKAPGMPPRPALELGLVVPKRHARRAVTRNLIKRQMREAVRHRRLAAGTWVVRLRSAFDPARFSAAASPALRKAAREELAVLFDRVTPP